MNLIGITGKSGSGKSYIARKVCENFENSRMISIDDYCSKLMNTSKIINVIQSQFLEYKNLIENEKINLDVILGEKEIFSKIYSLIENDLIKQVLDCINEYREQKIDTVVIEWWGLPKTDLMNLCDCSVYIENKSRLSALKKREKYIIQEDIDKRDETLAVDYENRDYDLIVENDMTEKNIDNAIKAMKIELETPSMKPEMHLDEFKDQMCQILRKYNSILEDRAKENFSEIEAYIMLSKFKKAKNTLKLGGFKKNLHSEMSEEDKIKNRTIMENIIRKTQEQFSDDSISADNIEEILLEKSVLIIEIINACKSELKQASLNTNHIITSSIYSSPEELIGGKLNCSKDVLNVNGDIGDWIFAQSGSLVDNPYILRRSGKGVCQDRDICIPGTENLVHSENGKAILEKSVYVYMMKTDEFDPVVSINYNGEIPQISFSGEWISEKDIDRMNMKVKKYTDITEMLDYMQIISITDRESFKTLTNSSYEDKISNIKQFSEQGKVHYINGECGINVKNEYLSTRDLMQQKNLEYKKILKDVNPEVIDRVLTILQERRKSNGQSMQSEVLDEGTSQVFEMMKQYEQDIKKIFIQNNEFLAHITKVSPQEMKDGKILTSKNRANNYETEYGDWVFASSEPVDGKNPYIARRAGDGMTRITDSTYIYGGDNMEIRADENGNNHVFLKEPNYVYKINPKDFSPVVTLKKDKNGEPYFEFSEEWVSEHDVDITNPDQVAEINEISDVTSVVENYQVFCDVNNQGIANELRSSDTMEQAMKKLYESIQEGRVRYINDEVCLNVKFAFNKENSQIRKNAFEDVMEDDKYRLEAEQDATKKVKDSFEKTEQLENIEK